MHWPYNTPTVLSLKVDELNEYFKVNSDESDWPVNLINILPSVQSNITNDPNNITNKINTSNTFHEVPENASLNSPDIFCAHNKAVHILSLNQDLHFATLCQKSLTVWQCRNLIPLAVTIRTSASCELYGINVEFSYSSLAQLFGVITSTNFLLLYSFVYNTNMENLKGINHIKDYFIGESATRSTFPRLLRGNYDNSECERHTLRGQIHLVQIVCLDQGINCLLAMPEGFYIGTAKSGSLYQLEYSVTNVSSPAKESRMSIEASAQPSYKLKSVWKNPENRATSIVSMAYDVILELLVWLMDDGRGFAMHKGDKKCEILNSTPECFHKSTSADLVGCTIDINGRASSIAIGCANGSVMIYRVKGTPFEFIHSHNLRPEDLGQRGSSVTLTKFSPDGFSIFIGYMMNWAFWTVSGYLGLSNFEICELREEVEWPKVVHSAEWLGKGCQLAVSSKEWTDGIWIIDIVRSAGSTVHTPTNMRLALFVTDSGFLIGRENYLAKSKKGLSMYRNANWSIITAPDSYLEDEWPISHAVISSDGIYVAVAGQRGLACYGLIDRRWKIFFGHKELETDFSFQGGMFWHDKALIMGVRRGHLNQVGAFICNESIKMNWNLDSIVLPHRIIRVLPDGSDLLLIYTDDNQLYRYMMKIQDGEFKFQQKHQVSLIGYIERPNLVRGINWIERASEMYLVVLYAGELVMITSQWIEENYRPVKRKTIALNVDFYYILEDCAVPLKWMEKTNEKVYTVWMCKGGKLEIMESLFDGSNLSELEDLDGVYKRDNRILQVGGDYFPLSLDLAQGCVLGVNINAEFGPTNSEFLIEMRTSLFVPNLILFYMTKGRKQEALRICEYYRNVEHFSHILELTVQLALEMQETKPVLKNVLDLVNEFPENLLILVQCIRKNEVSVWKNLLEYLPPVTSLFQTALDRNDLHIAAGFLLVIHGLTTEQAENFDQSFVVKLLTRAKQVNDWILCEEVSSFLLSMEISRPKLYEILNQVDKDLVDDALN